MTIAGLDMTQALPLHAVLDGPRNGVPVLLLTGLGQQATDWPDNLIAWLVAQGCCVIRPDNRDAGLSPLCGAAELAHLTMADFPDASPLSDAPDYRLLDMVADSLALLDRLGIAAAHVMGFSMGGMIAQMLAACALQRVLSLTSLMSSGGQPWVDCEKEAWQAMARSICTVSDATERLEHYVADALVYAGPSYPHDPQALRDHARAVLGRSYRPAGIWRQIRAVRAAGERRDLLREITVPTLFVHGTADNCIALPQAIEGHRLVCGSRFLRLEGAGHDLHPALVPLMVPQLQEQLASATSLP